MNNPINNDWTSFVPKNQDLQYSASTGVDGFDCCPEAVSHIIYMLTGFLPAPRTLAKMAGVTQQGSDFSMVSWAINKVGGGLVPYQLWPNPVSFTWASFYQELPANVTEFILPALISLVPPDLSKSPSLLRLVYPNGEAHFVAKINSHQYYDSEPGGAIKEIGYGGTIVTSENGIQISDSFFLKSHGFTPPQLANLPQNVQEAIKANDSGAKNIIIQPSPGNYQILVQQ